MNGIDYEMVYLLYDKYLSFLVLLQVTDKLSFLVTNTADLQNNVIAVERIKEYSEVEQEVSRMNVYLQMNFT